MKFMFISYSGYPQHSDNFIVNPGPTILATICNVEGIESSVLDLNRPNVFIDNPNLETLTDFLIGKLEEEKPDVIGVTTWFNAYQDNAKMLARIKEQFPKILIVGGGYHATWFQEDFLRVLPEITGKNKPVFDMLLTGEGEKPIRDLIEFLKGKRKKEEISGIIYPENGAIKKGAPQSFLPLSDLNRTPLPNWNHYQNLDEFWPIFIVDISRGCHYNCIMCAHHSMSGKKVRHRSVETIVDKIEEDITAYGVRHYRIGASTFSKKLITQFVDEVLERKVGFYWSCFAKANDFKREEDIELLQRMKESGCLAMFYGIESANEEILQKLNKKTTKDSIRRAILNTKEAGIKAIGSIMVGNPYETEKTLEETVDFVLDIRPDAVPSVPLTPLPRTGIASDPKSYGYILAEHWEKAVMLMKVEHIQDPDKWEYPLDLYRHPHNQMSFLDYTQKCGEISRKLFEEGINRLSDDVYLMADLLGKDPNQVYIEHSTKLKERDMAFFVNEIKAARTKGLVLNRSVKENDAR